MANLFFISGAYSRVDDDGALSIQNKAFTLSSSQPSLVESSEQGGCCAKVQSVFTEVLYHILDFINSLFGTSWGYTGQSNLDSPIKNYLVTTLEKCHLNRSEIRAVLPKLLGVIEGIRAELPQNVQEDNFSISHCQHSEGPNSTPTDALVMALRHHPEINLMTTAERIINGTDLNGLLTLRSGSSDHNNYQALRFDRV